MTPAEVDSATLGTTPKADAARDAVHVAMVPVEAGQMLSPGMHVGLADGRKAIAAADPIGIVDPFLRGMVDKGDRFWLCLYPNTVTGMRHHWSHPAFDTTTSSSQCRSESERWLEEFAKEIGWTYDRLIDHVTNVCNGGEPFVEQGGETMQDHFYMNQETFWEHFRNVTGFSQGGGPWVTPFSCSC